MLREKIPQGIRLLEAKTRNTFTLKEGKKVIGKNHSSIVFARF